MKQNRVSARLVGVVVAPATCSGPLSTPIISLVILRERARITVSGGLFFCALDSEELFARQGRTMEHEDPTQVCIKPMIWWHEELEDNGWEVCTQLWEPALRQHPETFLTRHDWDFFVARRQPTPPAQ